MHKLLTSSLPSALTLCKVPVLTHDLWTSFDSGIAQGKWKNKLANSHHYFMNKYICNNLSQKYLFLFFWCKVVLDVERFSDLLWSLACLNFRTMLNNVENGLNPGVTQPWWNLIVQEKGVLRRTLLVTSISTSSMKSSSESSEGFHPTLKCEIHLCWQVIYMGTMRINPPSKSNKWYV